MYKGSRHYSIGSHCVKSLVSPTAWEGSPLQRAMECDENKRAVMTFSSKSLPERTAVWRLGPKYPKFMETKTSSLGC